MCNIRNVFRKILHKIIRFCSWRKTILFESVPDCSDNTKAVFDEMVRRGLHKKYTFIWMLHSEAMPKTRLPGIKYIPGNGHGLLYRWSVLTAYARAQCMLCCNGFLLPVLSEQTAIFLSHGTPIKNVRDYYTVPEDIHYCLSASPGVEEFTSYQFNVNKKKMVSLGFPRNDVFAQKPKTVRRMLNTNCQKVIVWYPTFRKHNNGMVAGGANALPVIHNMDAAITLNEHAKRLNVLLVVKPHFAQDLSQIKKLSLSNIYFIDDTFFAQNQISSYEFVCGCDALITDYSSIYFDYMLCNKPIGLVWEDVEEYRENPGFAIDIDVYGKGGVQIYSIEDFMHFITEVHDETDSCKVARRDICRQVNFAIDGKNAERVVEFIIEKAKL